MSFTGFALNFTRGWRGNDGKRSNVGCSKRIFRAATNGDGARIRELIFDVLREYGLEPDPEGADADLRDIEAQYLAPGGSFECIEDAHGTLLGTVGLFRLDTTHCELRKMYFIPEARGKGLGKRTLARTLHHAKRLGFRKVNLETAGALKEAIGLYQRFGFRRIDAAPCVARCDQAYELDLDQWIPPGFCEESGVPHKIL